MNINVKKINLNTDNARLCNQISRTFKKKDRAPVFKKIVGEGVNKIISISIPDLTIDRELKHIKNVLLMFLFGIVIVYGTSIILLNRIILNSIPDSGAVKYMPAHEIKIRKMVRGRPLAKMMPYIARQDKKTAIFLVAIAKKESDWGKYSPKKGQKECYNYWGYRGTYNKTTSGYSCFDSEKQAVEVVGGRINDLINEGIDSPEKMIVWKCGNSCAGHGSESVRKWIADVDYYYQKMGG
jgi:hypothetical protein